MNKAQLLALDRLSGSSVKELHTADPELYKAVQSKLAAERKSSVLSTFATCSKELREHLGKIDFSPGEKPEREFKDFISDSFKVSGAKPELAKEAVERILDLQRSGLFRDPADVNTAVKDHPLFQQELQQATLFKLAGVVKLPDTKAEQVITRCGSAASVTDQSLRTLVKERVLADAEARAFGLTTTLYHIADNRMDVAGALGTGEFNSVVGSKLTQLRDLVAVTPGELAGVLERARVQPPDGMDLKRYAGQLHKRITDMFPTEVLFARIAEKKTDELAPVLEQLKPLFEKNEIVFGLPFENLKTEGLDARQLQAMREARVRLERITNLYPGLRIAEALNSKGSAVDKVRTVSKRLDFMNRIQTLNPDAEFLTLDYSPDSADVAALKFDGFSAEDKRLTLSNLKAYQRVFVLSSDANDTQVLLEAGYHSAAAIASGRFEAFWKNTGLPEAAAHACYDAARATVAAVSTKVVSIIDVLRGGFGGLGVANIGPSIDDYLKKLDGFADLFGSQDYCKCEHCQSILSPAAYFVDLMSFVEENVLDVFFTGDKRDHVLNLKVRRPDLWALPLTCANTDEIIPYLEIINEILENYIAKRRSFPGSLLDRGAVEEAVYHQAVSNSVQSFRQPFSLPIEKLNVYLAHFDRTRASVARTLGAAPSVLAAATLRFSKLEYNTITQPNNNIAFLRTLYGIQFVLGAGGKIDPFNAQEMLRYDTFKRTELGELVKTRFVTNSGADPVQIRAEKTSVDSVQNDIERIHNLTPDCLDRLHRFARIWRSVGWSVPELDLVFTHFAKAGIASGIGAATLESLVGVIALQERWNLPAEQNCAMWSDIPQISVVNGKQSILDRLFNLKPFVLLDGPLPMSAVKFIHPSFRQAGASSPADNTLNRLLAGLQVSDEQFAQLIGSLSGPLGINLSTSNENDRGFFLSVGNLTLLYRHARLAQLLKLSVADLFQLISLAGIGSSYVAGLADLGKLLKFYDWWKSSGFAKLDDLAFVTHGKVREPGTYPDKQAMAEQIVAAISSEKALQFADTVFAFLPGVTEDQSRSIIAANTAAIQPTSDASGLQLSSAFDPAVPLSIPAGMTVTEPEARALLLKYHASQVLPPRIASRLTMSAENLTALAAMTGLSLSSSALVTALQGGSLTPLADLLDKLFPLAVLFRNKVFDAPALQFVQTESALFGITDFGQIGMDSVRKLSLYASFVDTSKQASFTTEGVTLDPGTVQQALEGFDTVQKFANVDTKILAGALRVDAALVSTLLPNIGLPATAPEALATLGKCAELARYLGVDGETLKLIVSDDYGDLARASEAILSAFRAKYTEEKEFLDKLEPFEDRIRSRKRDALTDFLIRSIHPEFESMNELFEHFLVDVQLQGCARTSRVVAAVSSVQLYIHRCMMNLEQDRRVPADPKHVHVKPESIPADEWSWRKNYRVWEANRKVFLYPESYIEPELRDDKTPLFKDLESTLLQQEINEQNVLDAYATYLSGFEEVAKLKIAGACHDKDWGSRTDLLHLFGATVGDPPVYYYRAIENAYFGETDADRGIVYSPWRKIDVQIPVRRVAPIVYLGRLFVFWAETVTSAKNDVTGGASKFIGYKHKLSLKYTTLRLNGTWTPPQSIALSDANIFSSGDGIVDDPLSEPSEEEEYEEAVHGGIHIPGPSGGFNLPDVAGMWAALTKMQTPKYDTRTHLEPIDGYTLTGFQWNQVYPAIRPYGLFGMLGSLAALFLTSGGGVSGAHPAGPESTEHGDVQMIASGFDLAITTRNFCMRANIDFYNKVIDPIFLLNIHDSPVKKFPCSRSHGGKRQLCCGTQPTFFLDDYAHCSIVCDQRHLDTLAVLPETFWLSILLPSGLYSEPIAQLRYPDEISIINGSPADAIIDSTGDLLLIQGSVRPGFDFLMKRLGSTLGETLSRTLFTGGVDGLLDIKTEKSLKEAEAPVSPIAHLENAVVTGKMDFRGSLGTYFREIFFHVPFLVANHLNSQQRFAAAQRWYHYIFNPTASETIVIPSGLSAAERAKKERDRVWRYIEFRDLDIPKLRDILTDPVAIEVYKKDPFNPHAIARLRLSAYQKCIVMKYIDNLLDWGDSLFSQFTMESVNEATLLYVMAADILGARPAELGDCGEGKVTPKNYEKIGPLLKKGSDFLIELESYNLLGTGWLKSRPKQKLGNAYVLDPSVVQFYSLANALPLFTSTAFVQGASGEPASGTLAVSAHGAALSHDIAASPTGSAIARPYGWNDTRIGTWMITKDKVTKTDKTVHMVDSISPLIRDFGRIPNFGWSLTRQLSPVFCIPENKELSQYWDRVEDRLYKIRHCMDIAGVRRELALFAPEIDPRLLVRAKAAGLSIEDVLNATSGNLPPYRFSYLVEKAKQCIASVQSFGSALLNALEKRDLEELSRLRIVQQQNLLKLTTRVREWEIDITNDAITTLERQQAAIEYRRNYYQGLIDNKLSAAERTQQVTRYIQTILEGAAGITDTIAGIVYLIPQVGSPFAMKYGGDELGNSANAWAMVMRDAASVCEAIGACAGLEAGFQRREEGWQHQVQLAQHELNQIEKQLTAARLRKEIAVRSLDVHNKTIEQAEEIYEFYNDRFTNLGLYTWLSTTLQRVYREAYNGAYAMARLVEQAFRFERGDDTAMLLQGDYWDTSKAGLLAGERLMVDIQNIERRFIETNYRTLEIDQPFSLAQINPVALIQLRENGTCDFDVPEVFFDLFYPGQYRRKIKSVRLTIPCVTGPYTNVSATLTLTASKLRKDPKLGATYLVDVPRRRSVSVSTSTAQNDSGVFEFSFRDERYMPFEGAGAVSSWKLSLPRNFRQFDYQTINDVILHISYTAEEDGLLRDKIEEANSALEGTILNYVSNNSLGRVLSLRQDFSSAFNRLLHSAVDTPVKIEITDKYLPMFLRNRTIQVTKALLALKVAAGQTIGSFQIALNGAVQTNFAVDAQVGSLLVKNLGTVFSAGVFGTHTLTIKNAGDLAPVALQPGDSSALDSEKLLDVMLYFEYTVS